MYARVTTVEVDPVRVDVDATVEQYRREVLPALQREPGFVGTLVLTTPDGQGMVVSFWETADQADASKETGFYADLLGRYLTLFRSPPGREHYEVALLTLPAVDVT